MKPVLLASVTYNRRELVQKSLESWLRTIPVKLANWWLVDNGSEDGTAEWVKELALLYPHISAILLSKNLGTAMALNLAWREAQEGQHLVKADSDIVINTHGFMERTLVTLKAIPRLGILGLRRKDLIERPDHPDPWYRSQYLDLEFDDETIHLELANHIMGSFTIYNSTILKDFGYLDQLQSERWPKPAYGFDDSLACFRMMALGCARAFLLGWDDVTIDIDHVDPGEGNGSDSWSVDYTIWKQQEAGQWMRRYQERAQEYLDGKVSPHYSAEWDFEKAADSILEVVR